MFIFFNVQETRFCITSVHPLSECSVMVPVSMRTPSSNSLLCLVGSLKPEHQPCVASVLAACVFFGTLKPHRILCVRLLHPQGFPYM